MKLLTQTHDDARRALERSQMRRLRTYLKDTVLPFSARYGRLFEREKIAVSDLRRYVDLAAIPLTSKRDLLNTAKSPKRARDFVLVPDREVLARRPSTIARAMLRGKKHVGRRFEHEFRPLMMTSTTGRSADPVPFLFTAHDIENLTLTGRRLMEICDSRPEFRHVNMFPFAPHLAFWQTHYAGIGFNVFCVSTGGGKVMGTDGNVRMIEKIDPDALIGMPTFIYHVLEQAVAEDVHLGNIKRIVLGGEKVPEGMRRKLKALAARLGSGRVHVLATYGFTESKTAWTECPTSSGEGPSGYHLYPDLGIVEVVDPDTGRPMREGEPGEIVYNPLDSRGSVVIRYRTGDRIDGGINYSPCPHCGRRLPRLVGNISRVSEMRSMQFDKIKGTLVDFNELEHALDDYAPIGAWQIELRKVGDDPLELDELVVHVHRADANVDRAAIEREIAGRMLRCAEIRPNRVDFHDAEEMRTLHGVGEVLKEEKVVDHRPQARARSARVRPGATSGREGALQ